ncbi:MAG: hypothetical protein HYY30_04750 [Chloroflexi bacterium]|nr:hypothetical protein [Chloroflexota bacterium]
MHKFISVGGFAAALPPEVPQDRIENLRKVFQKLSDDKDVQQGIEKITGLSRPFVTGKEL